MALNTIPKSIVLTSEIANLIEIGDHLFRMIRYVDDGNGINVLNVSMR